MTEGLVFGSPYKVKKNEVCDGASKRSFQDLIKAVDRSVDACAAEAYPLIP